MITKEIKTVARNYAKAHGVSLAAAMEATAQLFGKKSWNVLQAEAGKADKDAAEPLDISKVMEIYMPSYFEYDNADLLPEWVFIMKHASFRHVDLNSPSVPAFEYILHIGEGSEARKYKNAPQGLRQFIDRAIKEKVARIIFFH